MMTSGIQPDYRTFPSVLKACRNLLDGMKIHCLALKFGFVWDVFVAASLVHLYCRYGPVANARRLFDEMPIRDMGSWNAMISGYCQSGNAKEALALSNELKVMDAVTIVSLLAACTEAGDFVRGVMIHLYSIKHGLDSELYVSNKLIDMYAESSLVDSARAVFDWLSTKDVISWNTIISGYAQNGFAKKAMTLFKEMLGESVKPDHITFVTLLSACSHSGLVDEGQWCFEMMQKDYGIAPSLKHYGCMVDLFGRAGHLETAFNFIKAMPIQPDASIWGALLSACRVQGNVDMGTITSEHLFEAEPEHVGYHVLLSNMYASAGKWEGVDEIRSIARGKGLRKTPGWSSMEVNNKVEVFYTGNQTHPMYEEIYRELTALHGKMKMIGYVPDHRFVLQDVEDDEKEHILMSHSERLAIVYGLIATPPKTAIRIFKNLRVCSDCHSVTKFISRITEREIIVRDSNRFHHFKDGVCSCGDYW
ncbi:unnamed protein product [Cochlearia groenlandica]